MYSQEAAKNSAELAERRASQPSNYQVGPDKTRIQAVLTNQGRKRLGIIKDREEGMITTSPQPTAIEVRRAGMTEVAKKTTAIVAAAGTAAVAGLLGPNVFGDSPDGTPADPSGAPRPAVIATPQAPETVVDKPDAAPPQSRLQ
jgi:hypothetical protein